MASVSLTSASVSSLILTRGSVTIGNNYGMEDVFNTMGAEAALPSIATTGNYELNNLWGLDNSYSENNLATGHFRTLRSPLGVDANSNIYFCSYNGNYVARSFKSGTTTIYKNGSSAGTITSARGTLSLNSLVVGDRISGDKPFVFYHNSNPGVQGAYGGYMGYMFATRIDRRTITFHIFNLDPDNSCSYIILRTSTSNANVTSMTNAGSGTISAGSYVAFGPTATQGNYYIQTSGLTCCVRGDYPSSDVVMMYPMSQENLYGWFSSNGHTFSVNNAECARLDSGGGDDILGRDVDNQSQTIIGSLGAGNGNTFTSDSVSTITGGNYFSGEASVVYNSSFAGVPTRPGTIFAAESQGDGNGTEMTSFTSATAHGRMCVSGGGAAWNAFVKVGWSASGGTTALGYPNYGDVIMRFNSGGTFQEALPFSGNNTTEPYLSSAYFGNGSGTGTSANAGDFFLCNVAVQGYQDTDQSDKDEANMIMTNDVDSLGANSYTIYAFNEDLEGVGTATDACNEIGTTYPHEVYSPGSFADGNVIFNDDVFFFPFGGATNYFVYYSGRTKYRFKCSGEGIISDFGLC
tara:strand:+ start:49 stop:1779 length:1731 start_codon:yes stop_codon:yes gene_type:complete